MRVSCSLAKSITLDSGLFANAVSSIKLLLVTSAISVSLLDDRYVPAWATKGSHLIFSETASWSTMSVPVLATMLQHCFRAVCALYVVISVVPVLHCTKIVLPPSLFLLEKMYDWVRPLRVVNR